MILGISQDIQELRFYSKMQKLLQELDFTVKYKSYYKS